MLQFVATANAIWETAGSITYQRTDTVYTVTVCIASSYRCLWTSTRSRHCLKHTMRFEKFAVYLWT